MTPDERKMLTDLASKVAQTPAPPRDPEAEELIRAQIGRRPDALYLMTQTVLIQNIALQHAQEQIQDLQQQLQQQQSAPVRQGGGSFLGSSGGSQGGYAQSGYQQSSYAQPMAPPPAQYAPQYAPPSGAPGFLRGAAQTAAGVAAGALAFEGIRSLFSHPGFGGGSEFGGFGAGSGMAPEVINNYYDTDSPHGEHSERLTDANDIQADNTGFNVADTDGANINDADNFDYSNQDNSTPDSDLGDDGGSYDDSGSDS